MMRETVRGIIIEKYSNMGNAYTCRRLQDEAKLRGMKLDVVGIHDVVIIDGTVYCGGERVNPCDFVINRYKSGNIKGELAALARRQYNDQQGFDKYVNKYEQVKNICPNTFLMPKYCLATAAKEYGCLSGILGEPFVAKGLASSQGREIFLISNEADLSRLQEEFDADKEWLFEEFIASSYGRDVRLYSVRGEVIACMTRISRDGFKANVALGADVEQYGVTEEIRRIARDIYEQTKLDFLGIDLLFGEDRLYFCEINVMPGIEGMERATGVNVAGKIIEIIKEDLDRE